MRVAKYKKKAKCITREERDLKLEQKNASKERNKENKLRKRQEVRQLGLKSH
jgi:hypothetical protein